MTPGRARGRVLVVRGEPGVGKSALLDYVAEQATGCQLARAAGVEYEAELTLAGLQQLLGASMLQRVRAPSRPTARRPQSRPRHAARACAGPLPRGPGHPRRAVQ